MKLRKLKPEDIDTIVDLYFRGGFSKLSIAQRYKIHHTTVMYHLDRHQEHSHIISHGISKRKRLVLLNDPENHFDIIEPTVKPKSYQEYLDEEEVRRMKKQEDCRHKSYAITIRCKCCGKAVCDEG